MFYSKLPNILRPSTPEIYQVIDDQQGDLHRTFFDLRMVHRGTEGNRSTAYTTIAFLMEFSKPSLTAFSPGRKGLANMVLWGKDLTPRLGAI